MVISGVLCQQYHAQLTAHVRPRGQDIVAVEDGTKLMMTKAARSNQSGCTLLSLDGHKAFYSVLRSRVLPALVDTTPTVTPYALTLCPRTPSKVLLQLERKSAEDISSTSDQHQDFN